MKRIATCADLVPLLLCLLSCSADHGNGESPKDVLTLESLQDRRALSNGGIALSDAGLRLLVELDRDYLDQVVGKVTFRGIGGRSRSFIKTIEALFEDEDAKLLVVRIFLDGDATSLYEVITNGRFVLPAKGTSAPFREFANRYLGR